MQFSFGAAAKGAREENAPEEKKTMATKPVFKGKAKLNTGPAATEDAAGSMSYDFSKMRMSAATTKKTEGAEGQGERGGERRGPRTFGDDDDFEVVAEKKKPVRKNYEEPKFGGGMPSFTRGGANAK